MAKTPNTSGTSYLPVSELLKRKDWRFFADFCSDTDTRLSQSALSSDPNLAAILLDASGMLESAILCGNAYQPSDLAALTGAGQAFLYRLMTDLVEGLTIERRPDKTREIPPAFARAKELLEKIRHGEQIFSFQESQNAGELDFQQEDEQDVVARNLSSVQMERFFARRGNRFPPSAPD